VQQLGCADLLDGGAVLERTKLDLIDEDTPVSIPRSISPVGTMCPISTADEGLLTAPQGNFNEKRNAHQRTTT
jgi:hypothetical protein